jgi:hypothetical protein
MCDHRNAMTTDAPSVLITVSIMLLTASRCHRTSGRWVIPQYCFALPLPGEMYGVSTPRHSHSSCLLPRWPNFCGLAAHRIQGATMHIKSTGFRDCSSTPTLL